MPPAPTPSTGSPFFWLTSAGHFLSPGHFLPVPRGSGPVLAFSPPGTSAAGLTRGRWCAARDPGSPPRPGPWGSAQLPPAGAAAPTLPPPQPLPAQPPPRCRGAAGSVSTPRTQPQARAPCRLRTAVATAVTARVSLCSGTSVRLCRASWLKTAVSSAFPVF